MARLDVAPREPVASRKSWFFRTGPDPLRLKPTHRSVSPGVTPWSKSSCWRRTGRSVAMCPRGLAPALELEHGLRGVLLPQTGIPP